MLSIRKLATAAVIALCSASVVAEDITIKLWSRADRSGPMRAGNIIEAAKTLNNIYKASGIDKEIIIDVHENNAKGFDADALDLMKAFAADRGPDLYVAAHEWIGAFVEAGYAMNMEQHIKSNHDLYGDIIPTLWESVSYKGQRYGIPQDSEIRMFFYNKDIMRKMGKSESEIETLPAKVESGEFTAYDLSDLAAEAVKSGAAKYGWIHRPNVGPDFLMVMASFGFDALDEASGKLQASKSSLEAFFKWLEYSVEVGALPKNMTTWSWDTVHAAFRSNEEAFMKFHGIWNVPKQMKVQNITTKDQYFHKFGWTHSPAAEKGGRPANLSHPIIYVVNEKSDKKEIAAYLVALASQPIANTRHAVSSGHTPINFSQAAMPEFVQDGWALQEGAKMLPYATFMPNHAQIGPFNAIIYKGIQGVETGRLSPKKGAEFVIAELQSELGKDVKILD